MTLVLVPAVVSDAAGDPVRGLERDDFRLRVDGRDTAIAHFAGGDAAVTLAIVLDASASMIGERMGAARAAAAALLARLRPGDRAALIAFDHRPRLLAGLEATADEQARALAELRSGGGTALYDALDLAIDTVGAEPGRKGIVLLSDGDDTTSRSSSAAVEAAARHEQVVLYAFRLGGSASARSFRRLARLAADLGGEAAAPATDAALVEAHVALIEELRSQYTLGFVPADPDDGRWHRIAVSVRTPGARVRARRGWLAR